MLRIYVLRFMIDLPSCGVVAHAAIPKLGRRPKGNVRNCPSRTEGSEFRLRAGTAIRAKEKGFSQDSHLPPLPRGWDTKERASASDPRVPRATCPRSTALFSGDNLVVPVLSPMLISDRHRGSGGALQLGARPPFSWPETVYFCGRATDPRVPVMLS